MESFHPRGNKRRQFTVATIVVFAFVVIAWIGYQYVFFARRNARLEFQQDLLLGIILGLKNFDEYNSFMVKSVVTDQSGNPCCSWRVSILDTLQGNEHHYVEGTKWDDPLNEGVVKERAGETWYCFSRSGVESPNTCVYAVVGKGTAFDPEHHRRFKELPPHLILLVEISESNTHWMQPGDLDVDRLPKSLTEGTDNTGVLVAFADGQVWFLDKSIPLQTLKKFFTIEDAKHYDREKLLEPYCKSRKGVTDKRNR